MDFNSWSDELRPSERRRSEEEAVDSLFLSPFPSFFLFLFSLPLFLSSLSLYFFIFFFLYRFSPPSLTYLPLCGLIHGSHHAMCHPHVPYHASQVSPSIWVRSLPRYAIFYPGLSSNNLCLNSSCFQRLEFS